MGGLQSNKKYIASHFFYDSEGSRIFQKIMAMPEYYLTDCETEIFELHKQRIGDLFCSGCTSLDLVELGAGDGTKTRILLGYLLGSGINVRYLPVDISWEALHQLQTTMRSHLPEIDLYPQHGDYFDMIRKMAGRNHSRKVILFLGSNLGNFDRSRRISFLSQLRDAMSEGDLLFLGLDLKKDPGVIRRAYDDPHGLTREFNLNLLRRMNRELGADFDPDHFMHVPIYHPGSGTAESYLVSTLEQSVRFSATEETIRFGKWEAVHTEMSQKFNREMIREMAAETGFSILHSFTDQRNYFLNSLWKKTL